MTMMSILISNAHRDCTQLVHGVVCLSTIHIRRFKQHSPRVTLEKILNSICQGATPDFENTRNIVSGLMSQIPLNRARHLDLEK